MWEEQNSKLSKSVFAHYPVNFADLPVGADDTVRP